MCAWNPSVIDHRKLKRNKQLAQQHFIIRIYCLLKVWSSVHNISITPPSSLHKDQRHKLSPFSYLFHFFFQCFSSYSSFLWLGCLSSTQPSFSPLWQYARRRSGLNFLPGHGFKHVWKMKLNFQEAPTACVQHSSRADWKMRNWPGVSSWSWSSLKWVPEKNILGRWRQPG